MHGPTDDSGTGLPILGTCTTEVCTFYDMGVYGIFLDYRVPMVFLGLFAGVQLFSYEWIYWGFGTFWVDEYTGDAFTRITTYS
jgi:hypothetical protein